MKPKVIDSAEIAENVKQQIEEIKWVTPPLKKKNLSLNHAIARTVKYNIDAKIKLYESMLAHTDLEATSLQMLPQLAVNAGYINRNNINEVLSPVSNQISTAEDRIRGVADLQFKWTILDFGISYYMSKQKADQALISHEERRRIVQQLAKETASNFWNAYALQKYNYTAPRYRSELKEAIYQSKQGQNETLLNAVNASQYRRGMWQIASSIQSRKISLMEARPRLMNLIHAPIEQRNIRLIAKPVELTVLPRNFPTKRSTLHKIALANRPEFIQGMYKKRMSLTEVKQAQLKMLPNLGLDYAGYFDSNSFYVNNNWVIKMLNVSWDLLSIPHKTKMFKLAKQQAELEKMRQLGLAMAIMTQVDIAKAQFDQSRDLLYYKSKILVNDEAIYQATSNSANDAFKTKLATSKAYTQLIESRLAYDIAYADYRVAAINLLQSIGRDPVSQVTIYNKPVSEITKEITKISTQWKNNIG